MKTCAIVAEPIACRELRVVDALIASMSLKDDGKWVRCMVVRFGFLLTHVAV